MKPIIDRKLAVITRHEIYPGPQFKLIGFVERGVMQTTISVDTNRGRPLHSTTLDYVVLDFDTADKWPVKRMWLFDLAKKEEINHPCVIVDKNNAMEIPGLFQDENMTREYG